MTATKKKQRPTVSDKSLLELAPYIRGTEHLDLESKHEPVTTEMFQDFWDHIQMDTTYQSLINSCVHYKDFFNVSADLDAMYPKEFQSDLFYAAKLGKLYEGVPMYLAYIVDKCIEEYPCGNLAVKFINTPLLNKVFAEGSTYTLYDVIADKLGKPYQVIDDNHYIAPYDRFSEVYIPKEDMVAIVPNDLAASLTPEFLSELELYEGGLATPDGTSLGSLSGYHNACNSNYDLRRLV